MSHNDTSVINRINALLDELNANSMLKTAAEDGSYHSDPGGYVGASTHPSARVPSNTREPKLGSRYRENTQQHKEEHPGSGVDAAEGTSYSAAQSSRQLNVGIRQSATGEDPAVEDNYKSYKDDPGTSHPANAEDIGRKYGSANFSNIVDEAYHKMNSILADIASGNHINELSVVKQATANVSGSDAELAVNAGYEFADLLLNEFEKQSQSVDNATATCGTNAVGLTEEQQNFIKLASAKDLVASIVKEASDDADKVAGYLTELAIQQKTMLEKLAFEEALAREALEQAVHGGDKAPAADVAPDEAANEEDESVDSADVDAINELANALVDAGISPEDLLEALKDRLEEEKEEAGTPMPKTSSYRELKNLVKIARKIRSHMASGNFRLKKANPGTAARKHRDEAIAYLQEICNR